MSDQPQAVAVTASNHATGPLWAFIATLVCGLIGCGLWIKLGPDGEHEHHDREHVACSCETYPWRVMRRQMGRPPYGVAGTSGEPGIWLDNDQPAVKYMLLRDLVGTAPHLYGEAQALMGSGAPMGDAPPEAK